MVLNDNLQMTNNKIKMCMSLKSKSNKKKLITALKTLQTGLKEADLEQPFDAIQIAIEALPEEELDEGQVLPLPGISDGEVAVYSDGACRGNPGPGSWAFVAQAPDGSVLQKASGVSELTTNNKMELQGAIEGLTFLEDYPQKFKKVVFHTDSKYVVDGITKWVNGWKARGWRKADKKVPENVELWKRLDELYGMFNVQFVWVKGHSGHPQNEMCDRMANEALDAQGF